jgi:hypothetical protein
MQNGGYLHCGGQNRTARYRPLRCQKLATALQYQVPALRPRIPTVRTDRYAVAGWANPTRYAGHLNRSQSPPCIRFEAGYLMAADHELRLHLKLEPPSTSMADP